MKWLALVFIAMLLNACEKPSPIVSSENTREPIKAVKFKEGKGLFLSDEAKQFAGIETIDVVLSNQAPFSGVITIPQEALLQGAKGTFVFVSNNGWYLRTAVSVGKKNDTSVEIKDGLYEGDTVIHKGVTALWITEIQETNGGVSCTHGH